MAQAPVDLSRAVWQTSSRSNNGGDCVAVAVAVAEEGDGA